MKCFDISFSSFLAILFFTGCISEKKENEELAFAQNRLAQSSSPYLISHADNPVDWYEWGPEALQKAKEEDKPVIISVGYAACHWCHVMEEESFMDPGVADLMNNNFVSIKIDREERPDIDKIYMDAAILINGSGGWPLNAIALPDGKPFFAGTYYTKEQWKNILGRVAEAYKIDKSELVNNAEALTEGIKSSNDFNTFPAKNNEFSETDYVAVLKDWQEQWDTYNGGYKGSQKFPLPVSWEALLQYYYLGGEDAALDMVNTTLQNMARGGIYDQLGGGFARYTTDPKWQIPHFEKMLYDNAQLISLYSKAYKVTGNSEYKQVVEESIEFVERELSNGDGAYYSSINADSDGEEGKYYVWSSEEIDKSLNASEAEIFKSYYNVESYGNWESGKNILYRNSSLNIFSEENNISSANVIETLNSAKKKLLKHRFTRIKPTIDNKVLTSWNALMIKAFIDAYTALGNKEYLERALDAGQFLSREMIGEDLVLKRSYKDGEKKINGFLDDYAFLTNAYIDLYQITFDTRWLDKAEVLTNKTIKNFRSDEEIMFYYTASGNDLIVRNKEIQDEVMPSSNAVMAKNLYLLGNLLENKNYLNLSEKMLQQISKVAMKNPSLYANWIELLGIKIYGAYEIAIVGGNAIQKNIEMNREYLPTAIFMGGETENLPLLKSKLITGKTLIYVCQNKTCKFPVSEVGEAIGLLESYNKKSDSKTWWNKNS